MTTTTYTVPDSPADPKAAAIELIVRFPEAMSHLRVQFRGQAELANT